MNTPQCSLPRGANDNIILDVRCGNHMMEDIKYWNDARKHSVVCTRFRLEETDSKLNAEGKP